MDELSERLRRLMDLRGYTAKDLGQKSGVGYRTIEGYLSSRKSTPRADFVYAIAKALETTVEFLIDDEDGANYVRTILEKEGRLYRPPTRIASIVNALGRMEDDKLSTVETMVLALAGADVRERAEGS